MALLLHAVLATDEVASPRAGLRGCPMCEIRVGELTAWATSCERFSPNREDLLAQHALLENALGACVPVRFPTWLAEEAALLDLLAQRHDELLAALARVRGRVELAVTITWTMDTQPRPAAVLARSRGRQYLEERRQRYAADEQRRAEAQRLSAVIEADERVLEARHSVTNLGLSSALLVGVDDAVAVAKRLEDLHEGVRILVNGPWPPYSFVSLEG